jgi:hypothetical protein
MALPLESCLFRKHRKDSLLDKKNDVKLHQNCDIHL